MMSVLQGGGTTRRAGAGTTGKGAVMACGRGCLGKTRARALGWMAAYMWGARSGQHCTRMARCLEEQQACLRDENSNLVALLSRGYQVLRTRWGHVLVLDKVCMAATS